MKRSSSAGVGRIIRSASLPGRTLPGGFFLFLLLFPLFFDRFGRLFLYIFSGVSSF